MRIHDRALINRVVLLPDAVPDVPTTPPPPNVVPKTAPAPGSPQPVADACCCDRCGTAMFRMHAVWRCPSCGYKTDCCGW